MTIADDDPNTELAVMLLASGHDARDLRRHAGFASLRDAREFAARSETKGEVRRAMEERAMRLGGKSMAAIEQLLDSDSTDGRTRVAAARVGLEIAGLLRRDQPAVAKELRELSVAELDEMIRETRADLARLQGRERDKHRPVAVVASS